MVLYLKKGEDAAYSYLYDHYSAALYGIILQIVPKQEIAQDVMQEVFVKIYQKISHYDSSKGGLYTWMLHITRNTAIDKVRSKGYKDARKIRSLSNDVNQNDTPSSEFPYVDHIGLEKVLSYLDETHRIIIDLAYFKGFTQKEISETLELPLGTVKTRARNALIQVGS